jgi:thiol-disulfide isomerase/thioredoxin
VPVDLEPGQKVELDLGGAGATIKGKVKLTGDVPAGLDCAYSVSYLVSRAPDIVALPAIADLGFDIRKGWQATWPNSLEGQAYLRTLRHWFVKLAPDGTFRISGVPPGDYDLAIEVYAKPSGCLVEPLARKVVLVTVTQGDVGRRELTLPEIAAKVTPIPVVGDTPSLSYERPDGAAGSLAGVRGHYTVVQFWANWCGLCKQQLPLLKQLQARFASQGLGVIGISVDTDAAAWQAAVKQLALPWPQGRLASAGDSGVPTVPGYWLLDPAGKIIAKGSAPKELMAALEKVEGNRTTSAKDAEPAGDAERHEPAVSRDGKNPQEEVVRGDVSSKGKAAYVMIRLPDGKPAVGAEARLCREKKDDLVERLSVSNGRITHRDASERRANVGADGRFRMEPQDNPFVLVVVHDAGIGEATSEELAAKPEVTLQAWGKVVGSVQRGAQPWPDLQIHADAVGAHNLLRFRETTKTDAKGNFAFPKLRPGKWRVEAMSVGTKAGKTSPADQTVDVAPGQSVSVAFHGVGRPAVGRIQWAGGKPPKGNLSRIMVAVHSVLSKPTPPPQEVCDQGPDAVRAWLKQWRESEEGKAWWSHNEQFYRPADASIDGKGALSVGAIEAGRYTLKAHMTSTEPRLPWERPKMLCYEGSFTMPEIAGGVSDEPLDLGSVQMVDKTPPAPRLDSVQPPASMPAGAKRVGGLRDHVELLRYVAAQNQQNKGKIRTWKGMATVEDRESADEEGVGYDSSTTVGFVFDQARKSVRWNETLDKWMRIERGQRIPQATPQIFNGMVTPGGLYRFAQSDDVLDDSDKRPMVLTICEPDDGSWGRLVKDSYGRQQPPFRDFNPMAGFDVGMFPFGDFSVLSSIDFLMLRGGLGQDLSVYLALADSPGLAGIKVILSGDTIMIDIGDADVCVRYTLSLSQGCNPIACDSILPVGHSEWRWTYESVDGIWVPKTFSETSHRKGKCDEQRKVTFVENRVNLSVEPGAFDLYRLGIQVGDKVVDQRTGQEYIYLGEDSVPNPAKAIRNR